MRQKILRHAFIILTGSFVLGLVTGAAHAMKHPSARSWLVAHITGIMVATLMAVVGLLWADLKLGRGASKALYWSTVHANYLAMVVLGVLSPALGGNPPMAVPDAPPPSGPVAALMSTGVLLSTVAGFTMAILVVYGLRTRSAEDA